MRCPTCDASLTTIEYEGIHLDACPEGCGEWLDASELRHVVQVREKRFNEEERCAVAAAAKITPMPLAEHDRDLTCPKCGAPTTPVNYGGDTGIVIDRCGGCRGIWLDAGELDNIQMVVEGWQDHLPADLKKHGARLRQIDDEVDRRTRFAGSRVGFVNSLINGIIDWAG